MRNQSIRKTDVLRLLAVIVVVMMTVASAAAVAVAVPSPPHEVFGTVTDQNGDAVAGATVSITDENGNTVTATTNSNGYYEIKYPAENADEGETLTVSVKSKSWTTTFSSGASEEKNFQVTVATPTETPTATEAPAGSGGGGGGGGGQQADEGGSADPVDMPDGGTINFRDVQSGETIGADFPSGAVASDIGEINRIELNMEFGDSSFRIEATPPQANPPSGTPPIDGAMAYMTIDAIGVEDSSIASAKITFTFTQRPSDVSPDDVVLYRYHDGEWQALETSHIEGDTYVATSPGFSAFAIGSAQQTPTDTPTDEPADESTDTPTDEPADETDSPTDEPADETDSPTPVKRGGGLGTTLVVAVVILILAAGGGYWLRRRD